LLHGHHTRKGARGRIEYQISLIGRHVFSNDAPPWF
jgi:hypothetical protein